MTVERSVESEPRAQAPRVGLTDPFGSLGKIVGAVAGAGAFLYVIGVAVLWEAAAGAHLMPRQVIAVIPRDQAAVLGARETLLSAIAGALFGLYLYAFYRIFRTSEHAGAPHGIRGRFTLWWRTNPAASITTIVAVLCMLFGPFDARGAVFLVLFLINLYFGMRSAHRSLIGELPGFRTSQRPWWRVALGLGIAIVIASLARQNEFPEQFAVAQVHFKPGTKIAADLRTGYLLYLGATPDTLVLGQPGAIKKGPDCTTTILPQPTRTLLVSRSSVESIELADGQQPCRPPSSLLRRLGIPIECIAPVCEVGNKRRSFLSPFASGEP